MTLKRYYGPNRSQVAQAKRERRERKQREKHEHHDKPEPVRFGETVKAPEQERD